MPVDCVTYRYTGVPGLLLYHSVLKVSWSKWSTIVADRICRFVVVYFATFV